jgi:Fe2+ transport system protein FeoA
MDAQMPDLSPSLSPTEPAQRLVPLCGLTNGHAGIVRRLEGGRSFLSRLTCLGFTAGALVTVLQNHGHGPLIVSLLGAHIALGRSEARQIQVQPL